MTRKVKIAAIQLPAWEEGDTPQARKDFRVRSIVDWLHAAGEAGADLACLGEMCTGSHDLEDAYTGPTTQQVQALARQYKMNVVLPLNAYVDGIQRNVTLVIDTGGAIVGHYNKVHPTRGEMEEGAVPGDNFPVFDLNFGRIGVVVCHDLSFPESARVVALRGAEIIVWPTLWSGWGEELCYAVIKSRAIDNGVWLVTSSFGVQPGQAWRPGMILGRSGVIGPDGLVLSSAGRYVGIAINEIDLAAPRIAHSFSWRGENDYWTSVLADRRPDAYTPITDDTYRIPATPPEERSGRFLRHVDAPFTLGADTPRAASEPTAPQFTEQANGRTR